MVLHNLPPGGLGRGRARHRLPAGPPGRVPRGLERAIDYAQGLGVPQLNCLAGLAPPGVPRTTLHGTLVDNLAFAAERLRRAGLRLLVEPINGFDMPGFFVDRPSQAFALLDEVADANLYVQYDCYHAHRTEGGLLDVLDAELARIAHLQVADHPGRHEPGTGEIDHAALFAELDRLGYAGWVGAEYLPATGTEAGLGWFAPFRGRG
jgi:hydroxypyruvate isomerase